MKKIMFLVVLVLAFSSHVFAWEDPCLATQFTYEYEGYTLGNWGETEPGFSPCPECQGTVMLFYPDNTWHLLDYMGGAGVLTIAGVPCRVDSVGNLVCKIITQPEKSILLTFGVK